MIDFELYRIFVIVAEEENITKASERLNISQPALTKQIKNIQATNPNTILSIPLVAPLITQMSSIIAKAINK